MRRHLRRLAGSARRHAVDLVLVGALAGYIFTLQNAT
jgi:hypothetical protein